MKPERVIHPKPKPLSWAKMQAMLPKVGDVLMEQPTIAENTMTKGPRYSNEPQRCVVVEVNHDHLWYRVRFEKTGICECYIVPKYRPQYGGSL